MAAPIARGTIDMTNLVTDPPITTAAPVSTKKSKPSTVTKGKSVAVPEDQETLTQRQKRMADEQATREKEHQRALLMSFYAP